MIHDWCTKNNLVLTQEQRDELEDIIIEYGIQEFKSRFNSWDVSKYYDT